MLQLNVGADKSQWPDVLEDGELEPILQAWDLVVTEKKPLDTNVRIKRRWEAPDLDENGNIQTTCTYLMLALYPDFDENGDVATIMSCLTDVR